MYAITLVEDTSTGEDEDVSGVATGLLIVAGVSGVLVAIIVIYLLARGISRIAGLISPGASAVKAKGKGKGRGKTDSGISAAAAAAAAAGTVSDGGGSGNNKERGPDLKKLIKDQKASTSKKGAVKDDQASHHPLFLNTLKGHGDVVHSVAWDGEGKQLATACEDMVVRLWDLLDVTSREPRFRRVKAAKLPVGAGWGDTPDTVVVLMRGAPDHVLALYGPAKEGQGYEQVWQVPSVHGKESALMLRCATAAASPAKRGIAVSCSQRKELRVYSMQGREIAMLEPNSFANHNLAVSHDGRFVAVASFTNEVKIWEVKWAKETGEPRGASKAMDLIGHKQQVLCVAFSPDSKRAVTASKDGTVRIWNIDVRYTMSEDPKTLLVCPQPLAGNRLYQHLAYGPHGIVAASCDGTVHFLSASTGELLDSIDAHDGPITSMQWCPRLVKTPGSSEPHAVLATSSKDKRVRLWRAPEA